SADAYTSNLPLFTSSSFAALMAGINPATSNTINFNGFTPAANASQGFLFFVIYNSLGNVVFNAGNGFLSPSTTSAVIPAGTLSPFTQYTFELNFDDRVYGVDAGGSGIPTQIQFDFRNDTLFSTGAAVATPEPSSGLLLLTAIGFVVGLLRLRKSA